jgi:hypothetical protein
MQSFKYWTLNRSWTGSTPSPWKNTSLCCHHHMQKKKESQFKPWMLAQIIILSNPYIWHLLLIHIHKGPSNPHICRLLSPHLWYQYLEIEKCCTLCCVGLLFPSWLMYPILELGQFVMQFIFKTISNYWLSLQEWTSKLEPYVLKINLEWEGTCI